MDLNYILLWIVGISCALHIYRLAAISVKDYKNVLLICAGILGLQFVAYILYPDLAGFIAFAAWMAFLIIPAMLKKQKIKAALKADPNYQPAKRTNKITVIKFLIVLNVAAFIASEVLGGSTNPEVLVFLGALVPELAYIYQEWWRLLTATFLHFGLLHLFMNCFALYVLGPFVERVLGSTRFLIVYLAAGIASMALIVGLNFFGLHPSRLVIGASGSVMGIIGATAGIYFISWFKTRALTSTQELKNIGLILLIQAAFDLSTPQVSFTAHFGGVVAGFILCLVFYKKS
ncbi:MAG: rhomboid family intramembrane serine protease [Bdellovibrionota bacterium]